MKNIIKAFRWCSCAYVVYLGVYLVASYPYAAGIPALFGLSYLGYALLKPQEYEDIFIEENLNLEGIEAPEDVGYLNGYNDALVGLAKDLGFEVEVLQQKTTYKITKGNHEND